MKHLAFLFLCLCTFGHVSAQIHVYFLRCEQLLEPIAIDSPSPHFSWRIQSNAARQSAFEIQVASSRKLLLSGKADLWNSGKVISCQQVMIPYQGRPLSPRSLYVWRVRVWDSDGVASAWSDVQTFGVGVIGSDYIKGDFIGAVPGEGRAPLLRKTFSLKKKGSPAILYVNSLGYHEAYVNGRKVTDAVLAPAVSQLNRRSLIVAYDVTSLLKKGKNEIVLWTSSGWYKQLTFGSVYDGPLVKAELDLISPDGLVPLTWTDASWMGAWSGYRDYDTWRPHHFGGEEMDARVFPVAFDKTHLDALSWQKVDVVKVDGIAASQQMCEPCRVQETLCPVRVKSLGNDSWLVDFGRIVNALTDIRLPQLPAGHVTKASFSDFQDADGTLELGSANYYISSGANQGDRFVNHFNHHVFRYIRLDSLPVAPKLEDMRALRMRTDFASAASFRCSDDDLNRIHDMVAYTLDNLSFNGYMVDCANIERMGYGGDGNASTLSLQILYDVAPLYVNWLQAWNDVVHPDGGLPHTAPSPYSAGGGPYWCSFIAQAPWRTFMCYADDRLLRRCYPYAQQWLKYVDKYTIDGLLRKWPDTDYRSWYLGDWAAPKGVDVQDSVSIDLVNNCAMCQTYLCLEATARHLGKEDDAVGFRQRFEKLAGRINDVFFHPETHTYGSASQIDMTYPLLIGIVPAKERDAVRDALFQITDSLYGGRLMTGLVGIPVITEWATREGECEWMYSMLKKHGYPGFLHMLDEGATATWEHWDGERSRLHNCFNGIGSWFYQALGGIVPVEPGYRHVRIAPQVPKGLEWVHVAQNTPYGQLVVNRSGRALHLEIPVGVKATIGSQDYTSGVYDISL